MLENVAANTADTTSNIGIQRHLLMSIVEFLWVHDYDDAFICFETLEIEDGYGS